ncbi:hypothetical protein BHE74_00036536 [Ensete ventricosum]|nr:hypothetical protein BHE74_00036536 [Ensete ventricosum]RZR87756.1 hypothetical protein BHM03_00015203 [Ensete ventricosum]
MEDRLCALFAKFKLGRYPSPTNFQQGESLERPSEKEGQPSNMMQPCMRVDFPRWEGDPIGWIPRVELTTADAGPQDQDVPTIGPRGTLVRNCISQPRDMELSLEDKADLKRVSLLGH